MPGTFRGSSSCRVSSRRKLHFSCARRCHAVFTETFQRLDGKNPRCPRQMGFHINIHKPPNLGTVPSTHSETTVNHLWHQLRFTRIFRCKTPRGSSGVSGSVVAQGLQLTSFRHHIPPRCEPIEKQHTEKIVGSWMKHRCSFPREEMENSVFSRKTWSIG